MLLSLFVLNGSPSPLGVSSLIATRPNACHATHVSAVVEQEAKKTDAYHCLPAIGWQLSPTTIQRAREMLLVYQVGSVKVGEVVR